jgi:hypothetical protein
MRLLERILTQILFFMNVTPRGLVNKYQHSFETPKYWSVVKMQHPRRLENVWNNIYVGKNDMMLGEPLVMSKCNRWPQLKKKKFLHSTTSFVSENFYENKLFLRWDFWRGTLRLGWLNLRVRIHIGSGITEVYMSASKYQTPIIPSSFITV